MAQIKMEEIVNYCKQYGFIFQGSEIYGGLANTWDYGPLGVELKENVRRAWWQKFIQENPYNYGLQSAILMNPQVWVTTGHVTSFCDPLTDCRKCKSRYRVDKLIIEAENRQGNTVICDGWNNKKLEKYLVDHKIACPNCGSHDFTKIREFNTMFKTFQGVTEEAKDTIYLRPETAQGMFVNYKNVERSLRLKLPFGIGQTGKSFRNEITPGNFTFRTREFEQMELEFFCKPGTDLEWFGYYKNFCLDWLKSLGLSSQHLRLRDHEAEELAFYSKATTDIEYLFPHGWDELWGIADRSDYDLKVHAEATKTDLTYLDPEDNTRYLPYCIEPALGLDRVILAFISDAYQIEKINEADEREILKIHPALAPIKIAILPLIKKYHSTKATELYAALCKKYQCNYDEAGSIGKRYRRNDAIGTPYSITVDDETLNNQTVTIRDRDTMRQEVVAIKDLDEYFQDRFSF